MGITIKSVDSNFERSPLIRPFGFKGGYMSDIWQVAVKLETETGSHIGLGTQSTLWSDAAVFASNSEAAGNAMMMTMTNFALSQAIGVEFETPLDLLDRLLEPTWEYGCQITGRSDLRKTFALNALVAVDNAAWLAYAAHHGISHYDDLVPEQFRKALPEHHDAVAAIPLMAYAIPLDEIVQAVEDGYFFMKIKIGRPGTQEEMLAGDMARLTEIHNAIGGMTTPHSESGKLPYYFDANGRYEEIDTLRRLLDHADKIGALEQIAVVEEPFPEEYMEEVGDLGVRIAADESAHTDADAKHRIELGYTAMALKPIAKTMSMSLRVAQTAHEQNIPCFCADLTVNPILVEWNKAFAARLKAFPGLKVGLVETNGHQNYAQWAEMQSWNPQHGAEWTKQQGGCFQLSDEYYACSGGIFEPSPHYVEMFVQR
jgi:L-alanine-DL-glutamate epimerase-like enolase superfamily enzyme